MFGVHFSPRLTCVCTCERKVDAAERSLGGRKKGEKGKSKDGGGTGGAKNTVPEAERIPGVFTNPDDLLSGRKVTSILCFLCFPFGFQSSLRMWLVMPQNGFIALHGALPLRSALQQVRASSLWLCQKPHRSGENCGLSGPPAFPIAGAQGFKTWKEALEGGAGRRSDWLARR